jgi:hypothetical protein
MRHSWKIAAAALAAVALMSFAAACGDDNSSKDTTTPAGTSTQAATSTGSAASATSGNSTATAEASGTSGVSDAIDNLQKSSDNFVKAAYDVSYSLSTTSAGKTSNSTMVIKHKDNKDYVSINGDLDGSGTSTNAIIIDDGTNSYLCTESPEKACLKTAAEGSSGNVGQIFTSLKPDKLLGAIDSEKGAKVDDASGRKVAGRDTKCYKITSSEGNGTICFDKDTDIMLYLDMTGGSDGATKFEATKVGGSPGDDAFKPPYPVQDLGSGS